MRDFVWWDHTGRVLGSAGPTGDAVAGSETMVPVGCSGAGSARVGIWLNTARQRPHWTLKGVPATATLSCTEKTAWHWLHSISKGQLLAVSALSSPKAVCSARTASSAYFSSIRQEILISDVLITRMLTPSSARTWNIFAATPA